MISLLRSCATEELGRINLEYRFHILERNLMRNCEFFELAGDDGFLETPEMKVLLYNTGRLDS